MPSLINYYQILGLNTLADLSEVKKAYRLYAQHYHPDKHNGNVFFEERFREILEAYETLSDEKKRKIYDDNLRRNSSVGYQSNFDVNKRELTVLQKERDLINQKELLLKRQLQLDQQENEIKIKKWELNRLQEELNETQKQIIVQKEQFNQSLFEFERERYEFRMDKGIFPSTTKPKSIKTERKTSKIQFDWLQWWKELTEEWKDVLKTNLNIEYYEEINIDPTEDQLKLISNLEEIDCFGQNIQSLKVLYPMRKLKAIHCLDCPLDEKEIIQFQKRKKNRNG